MMNSSCVLNTGLTDKHETGNVLPRVITSGRIYKLCHKQFCVRVQKLSSVCSSSCLKKQSNTFCLMKYRNIKFRVKEILHEAFLWRVSHLSLLHACTETWNNAQRMLTRNHLPWSVTPDEFNSRIWLSLVFSNNPSRAVFFLYIQDRNLCNHWTPIFQGYVTDYRSLLP